MKIIRVREVGGETFLLNQKVEIGKIKNLIGFFHFVEVVVIYFSLSLSSARAFAFVCRC